MALQFAYVRQELEESEYSRMIAEMQTLPDKISKILEEKERLQKSYNEYVEEVTPKASLPKRMFFAFLVGGAICVLGQWITNRVMAAGVDKDTAGSYCSMFLILLSVLLTGFNLYPKLADFGGAGALVPITGFANSVAAPAIEFQKEGQVYGIGCKIFTIAGPVILYGIFTSWVAGVIYWCGGMLGSGSGNWQKGTSLRGRWTAGRTESWRGREKEEARMMKNETAVGGTGHVHEFLLYAGRECQSAGKVRSHDRGGETAGAGGGQERPLQGGDPQPGTGCGGIVKNL